MDGKEFLVNGFKVTIIKKPDFEAIGYTRPVNLDGGSIGSFIKELTKNGQIDKLSSMLDEPQQIWVCLSDIGCTASNPFCDVCDLSCSGFQTRCTVCVEKTAKHDFSSYKEDALMTFSVPSSEWAVFEVNEEQDATDLHKFGVYNMVSEIGYRYNDKIKLHFDNEHEWEPGRKMYFLLPVTPT